MFEGGVEAMQLLVDFGGGREPVFPQLSQLALQV